MSYGFSLCSAAVLCMYPVVARFPVLVATGFSSRPAITVHHQKGKAPNRVEAEGALCRQMKECPYKTRKIRRFHPCLSDLLCKSEGMLTKEKIELGHYHHNPPNRSYSLLSFLGVILA